jgi:putative aldouronate transport system substrate-binding protein
MKNLKHLYIVASIAIASLTLLSACKESIVDKSSNINRNVNSAGIDVTKEVKLTGYLLGTAPEGFKDVLAELNKKLKKDINASMDINYLGWGDYQSKYPLVLASGEDVDWIFTGDWAFYQQEAGKSAFREITKEDLRKYMPLHYAKLSEEAYKEATLGGKVYMIPSSTPDKKLQTVIIRGDIRKKYGIPEIKAVDQLEPYLEAVKNNERNMIPIYLDSQYDPGTIFADLQMIYGYSTSGDLIRSVSYNQLTKSGEVYDLFGENNGYSGRKAAETLKNWYDKGYINKNPFANKVRSKDLLVQGKSAVGLGNSVDIQSTIVQSDTLGMDMEIIPVLSPEGKAIANSFLNNGAAIAASSKNPERTMMALDRIMEDKDYDYLVYFGIEGKNYVITPDNKIGLPSGVTADNNTYAPDAAGFWFTNKDIFLPLATWPEEYLKLKNKIPSMLIQSPWATFSFDQSNVKTEVAALKEIDMQYFSPIEIGAVKNVEEAIKNLREKENAVGWQKVYNEVKKQANEYFSGKR